MADYDLFAWLDQDHPHDHWGDLLGTLTTEQVIALSPSLLKAQQAHDIILPFIGQGRIRRSGVRALIRILEDDAAVQQDPVISRALTAALAIFRVAADLRVGVVWTTP